MTTITETIIDQDATPSAAAAYILTATQLYRSLTVTGVNVWTPVLLNTAFSELLSVTFSRVRAGNGGVYVYVLGTGITPDSGGNYDTICFYSWNGGNAWSWTGLGATAPVEKPYTVSIGSAGPSCGDHTSPAAYPEAACPGTGSPYAVIVTGFGAAEPWIGVEAAGILNLAGSNLGGANRGYLYCDIDNTLTAPQSAAAVAWVEDFFGTTPSWPWSMYWRQALNAGGFVRFKVDHFSGDDTPHCAGGMAWAFYPYPSVVQATAIDCGRHDNKKVYIGSDDTIYRSIDGGAHFDPYIVYGAYDIECHYAQDPADDNVTVIAPDGLMFRSIGSTVGSVFGGVADVVPTKIPLRIASDTVNGFPLWVLEAQGGESYKLRKSVDGVAWTDMIVDCSFARSLKTYATVDTQARRIVFMKDDGIWYSTDEINFTNKIGDYGAIGIPVVINLF